MSDKKVKVKLEKAITFYGEPKAPGDEIEIYPDQAAWLAKQGAVKAPRGLRNADDSE